MIIEKIPFLRTGMKLGTVTLQDQHLVQLADKIREPIRRKMLWGTNQPVKEENAGFLMRSGVSHQVCGIHLMNASLWVDIEPTSHTRPGSDLLRISQDPNYSLQAFLRVIGQPRGLFERTAQPIATKIVAIDVYPMSAENQQEWSEFLVLNFDLGGGGNEND